LADLPSARPSLPGWSERTLTILVAEDEPLVRAVLVDCLEERGFNVLEASNATSAIQLIAYSDFTICAVVTDICMPGDIDGIGLMHWVHHNRPGIPVIVTSGFCTEQAQLDARDGAYFYAKPYDCEKLAIKLTELIGRPLESR
jgi:DNA-binding NtrC family response regulator